jgi:hypothetical protein
LCRELPQPFLARGAIAKVDGDDGSARGIQLLPVERAQFLEARTSGKSLVALFHSNGSEPFALDIFPPPVLQL